MLLEIKEEVVSTLKKKYWNTGFRYQVLNFCCVHYLQVC